MKPFAVAGATIAFNAAEAAPARARVRLLAILIGLALLVLCGRAVQLAFAGDPLARAHARAAPLEAVRADLVDRNGVLLATTVRAYALTAQPARVWDARETALALTRMFPELDRAATERRLRDRSRDLVYLRRGLSPGQRAQVMERGLAGIGFEAEPRRVYPNGALAGHALGFTDRDLRPLAGAERGLDSAIAHGERAVRLTLDVRVQHAAEAELSAAARASQASGGAVIVLDGRNGDVLALASWPELDPNHAGEATNAARRNRVSGDRYEMGSTMKPFIVAMGLDLGLTNTGERFNLTGPYEIDGRVIRDHEPTPAPYRLREIISHSSNKGAAMVALRIGAARERTFLSRLGLDRASGLELAEDAAPIAPRLESRLDVATLGFGYGMAASPAALAGAYTVFANQGRRVAPHLRARAPDAPVERIAVFTPAATAETLAMMRATVTQGTGRAADVPGLAIAGKTGTAEKLEGGSYNADRMFSSFAAIFPASDPRYVIVLALDEPARTNATGGLATGGAVAAGPVGRIAARIAPMLGLRVEPRQARAAPSGRR